MLPHLGRVDLVIEMDEDVSEAAQAAQMLVSLGGDHAPLVNRSQALLISSAVLTEVGDENVLGDVKNNARGGDEAALDHPLMA